MSTLYRWLLLLSVPAGLTWDSAHASEPATVHQAIDRAVELILDGEALENRERRVVRAVELGDSYLYAGVVSISRMYGGNSGGHYLLLLESDDIEHRSKGGDDPGRVHLRALSNISGKYWRSIDPTRLSVENGELVFPAQVWAQGDPGCCPSVETVLRFGYENGQLVERQARAREPLVAGED